MKPPIVSLWPPRYFVVECTTASAPSSSGCCRYGVAKVLSTTSSAPTACAAAAALRMSTMFSIGFDGVSTQTSFTSSSRCDARLSSNSRRGHVREAIALRLVDLRRHPVDAAVDVGDQDDALARMHEVHQRGRRAEPRAERDAVLRVLEAGQRDLQRGAGRVRDARVVVALVHPDRLLHERGGLVDRRDDRAGRRIRLLPRVDRPRLEVHARSLTDRTASVPAASERDTSGSDPIHGRTRRSGARMDDRSEPLPFVMDFGSRQCPRTRLGSDPDLSSPD